jgi:DNA-binding PadR family transcriptional regulator
MDLTLLQLKVLWLISKKPLHGYELMEKMKLKQGTIYPMFHSLEKNNLIKPSKIKNKKLYNITPKGNKTLKNVCIEFCSIYHEIFKEYVCTKCGDTK